jgi:hypothetical protein
MKGLIVSLITVGLVVAAAACTAQLFRPRRHLPMFVAWSLVGSLGYTTLFTVTPPDLWFLGKGWQCSSAWLDFLYGLAVYVLNSHTWIDVFFGTCGGFSSAILLVMRRARKPVRTDDVASVFGFAENGGDRIFAARIPNLVRWGYVSCETGSNRMRLTRKGRVLALVVSRIKRMMNLEAGG